MKKVFLPVVLLCLATTMFAQKSNISKAKVKVFNVEAPDFKGAKELMDAALIHPETKDDIKTWWAAAQVYNEIQMQETVKQTMGFSFDESLRDATLLKVLDCALKTDELDHMPDKKGAVKPKYTKKIKTLLTDLFNSPSIQYCAGAAFERKDFATAAKVFDIYVEIPTIEFMKPLALDNDSNYAFIKYNAGIAHIQAAEKENLSKAIQYFGELTTSSYEDKNSVYQILSTLYLQVGDTANYVRTLEEAVEKFPGETYYINFLIEHLLKTNQSDKAVAYLERAIANDPSFANYYFILGYVKEGLGLKDEAIEQYDKAIAINPEYVEAIFGKGLNLYNRAVEADNKASEIQDYKLYQQERQKVDEMIMAALPYFEKVLELKPEDDVNLRTLKGIYYRFSSKDKEFERKYNDMDKRMKELGY